MFCFKSSYWLIYLNVDRSSIKKVFWKISQNSPKPTFRIVPCNFTKKSFVVGKKQLSKVLHKRGVRKNFAKFTGNHQCQSLIFNKVAGLRLKFKKRLWERCFPANFAKNLKTFFKEHLRATASGKCFPVNFANLSKYADHQGSSNCPTLNTWARLLWII